MKSGAEPWIYRDGGKFIHEENFKTWGGTFTEKLKEINYMKDNIYIGEKMLGGANAPPKAWIDSPGWNMRESKIGEIRY